MAMEATRRAALAGMGASLIAAPAVAAPVPKAVRSNPAFRRWKTVRNPPAPPLDGKVTLLDGREASLRDWIGPGPSVLLLWALWCPPCMAENPGLALFQRRLTAMKSNTRLRCLQAYDDKSLAVAKSTLDRMKCSELQIARATPALERAFVGFFGKSPVDPRRTSLPSLVMLDGKGAELGRAEGALEFERTIYWSDPKTAQFLGSLERLLKDA